MVSHSTETQSDASLPLIADEEETLLRDTVARIVAKYGHDYYQKCSATGEPMQDLWDELGRNGYLGLNIAEEYGGSGAGLTQQAIVSEELAAGGCPELAMVLSQGIAGSVFGRHGTEEQKQQYLPGIASGEKKFVFALTEPDAGSNSHNVSTTATRDGDDYIVNGTKYYISGVDHCDNFLLVARTGTDEKTGRGLLTLFVVDPDVEGLTRELIPTALSAPRTSVHTLLRQRTHPCRSGCRRSQQGPGALV